MSAEKGRVDVGSGLFVPTYLERPLVAPDQPWLSLAFGLRCSCIRRSSKPWRMTRFGFVSRYYGRKPSKSRIRFIRSSSLRRSKLR